VSATLHCSLGAGGGPAPEKPPIIIQTGLKTSVDLWYFNLPMLLQIVLTPQPQPNLHELRALWNQVPYSQDWTTQLQKLSPALSNAGDVIERLKENNVCFMEQGRNDFE